MVSSTAIHCYGSTCTGWAGLSAGSLHFLIQRSRLLSFSSGKDGQGGTRPTSSTLSLHCTHCTALLCAALNHHHYYHYYTTTLTSLILTSSKRPPPHPRVRSHNSQGSIRFRRRWAHPRRCSALHLSIRVHDHLGLPRITGSWR
jgi:hypothetical protein